MTRRSIDSEDGRHAASTGTLGRRHRTDSQSARAPGGDSIVEGERTGMTHRVLIVEDHPLFRVGIRALVDASPGFHVVDEAATGREAIAKTLALRPDLILVDMTLPDISGLDVIAQIRRHLP